MIRSITIAVVCLGASACSVFTPAVIKTVLDTAQLTCILLSESTRAEELMQACRIEQALKPAVEQAIGARVAAKKAGFNVRPQTKESTAN